MGWRDTVKTASWKDTIKDEISGLESAGRGIAQGASLGFADEIVGGAEAAFNAAKNLDLSNLEEDYLKSRDESRQNFKAAKEANPAAYVGGQLGGSLATSFIPGLGAGGLAKTALTAAGLGAATAVGEEESGNLADLGASALKGGAIGGTGGVLGYGIGKMAPKLRDYLAGKSKNLARYMALNSTGATGKELQKMKPETADYLLENNIVGFFDDAESIARKAGNKVDEVFSPVNSIMDDPNLQVSTNELKNKIISKSGELSKNEALTDVANALKNKADDLPSQFTLDETTLDPMENFRHIKDIENIKRDFGDKIKNWVDPSSARTNKELYDIYKNTVESTLEKASASGNELFKKAKDAYGILSPVQEAAINRAAQQKASQVGGFLDVASGIFAGEPATGAATAVGRRLFAPRVASSSAVLADSMSKMLQSGKLSKFSNALNSALSRGPQAVIATDYLLQQMSPEYRQELYGKED